MVTIIERTGGRYEIQDVEFGKVYKWCPHRRRVPLRADAGPHKLPDHLPVRG